MEAHSGSDIAAAPALALAIFQRGYYGSWIPNTATLKRSAGILSVFPGIEYVLVSVFRYPFNAVAIIGAIFGASRLSRRAAVLIASLAGGYLVYVVSVGGDHFAHARFLLPLLPTATVLADGRFVENPAWVGYAEKISDPSCRGGDDRSDRL